LHPFGQMTENVSSLVGLTASDDAQAAENLADGRPECLGAIDHEEPGLFLSQPVIQ
jgi:hypothetical protein